MNKRLKELAKKSGATINEGFDGKKNFVYSITMSPDELEKFVMLVIQDYENDKRESRREVKSELGYSRIGLGNV